MVTNEWFLDDGALGGRKQDLQQAVHLLIQQVPELGLHLNSLKSSVQLTTKMLTHWTEGYPVWAKKESSCWELQLEAIHSRR